MELMVLARIVHILSIVVWIGGVSMVTTVLLPALDKLETYESKIKTFAKLEKNFSLQARITVLLAGASGFYMLYELDAWYRYLDTKFWWIHAMTFVWIIFFSILFFVEPIISKKLNYLVEKYGEDKLLQRIRFVHWVLLIFSMIAIVGGMAGAHGWYFF